MKLLLLRSGGHEVVHVRERGLTSADDGILLELARLEHRVLISADTDFSALLAWSNARFPSIILWRASDHSPSKQARRLIEVLQRSEQDLEGGAVVVVEDKRIRTRILPIGS